MAGIKLHLGCGKRYLKGYVHVDLADYPHIQFRHDIRALPMFKDGSVDLIYASHVLEYMDRPEVPRVLGEWNRVLRTGGALRLAVPDFEALAEVYSAYRNMNLVLGPLYGRWPVPGSDMVLFHKTVYDYSSLKEVLEEAGFTDIRKWDWRKVFVGELEGYDDYCRAYIPHMDSENGRLVSLNVEASK